VQADNTSCDGRRVITKMRKIGKVQSLGQESGDK